MGLFSGFKKFFSISSAKPELSHEELQHKVHRSFALQSFIAGTLGYSLYYVCRTSLNVMKDPIIEHEALKTLVFPLFGKEFVLDAETQLGIIGGVLLFAYAIGKLVNGFIADHCNIKRFMATGLLVSALANLTMGVVGLLGGGNEFFESAMVPSFVVFIVFAVMWGINGWSQSMGAAPAIIALSRWFPLSRRGTFYGFFSASHNIGEWLSFIFVGSIVATAGWQWGFFGSSVAGAIGVIIILFMMHDTPTSKGLPAIEVLTGDKVESKKKDESIGDIQKQVLRMPAVWILALASAFMYISRYSLNSWGILFLQKEKGFDLETATFIISINALLGIIGTVVAGWMSDVLFKGNRKIPAFISGVLLSIAYALFLYGGNEYWINIASMVLFGIAIGVLIAFLGGLMAVDVVPRRASGAALGVVGIASYVAAGLQDIISGWLIGRGKIVKEEALSPETKDMLENVIKLADEAKINAGESTQLIEKIHDIKPEILDAEMSGQISDKFAKAFIKMSDQIGELGAKYSDGANKVADKVVDFAEKALEKGTIEVTQYDFSSAAIFWLGASIISFLIPILLWGKKAKQDE